MDKTITLAFLTMLSWGMGAFLSKLAANRIGERAVLWDMIGFIPVTILYTFFLVRAKDFLVADKLGVMLAILSGAIGAFGGVWFYVLMTKKEASVVTPLTALYPALTAILAFIFLKEPLTFPRVAGIILASAAVLLLSL